MLLTTKTTITTTTTLRLHTHTKRTYRPSIRYQNATLSDLIEGMARVLKLGVD
jgi:hypothetical protein